MAATADQHDPTALPFRVSVLERNETQIADKLSRVDDKTQELEVHQAAYHATFTEQVGHLRFDMGLLRDTIDSARRTTRGVGASIVGAAILVIFFGPN